MVTIHVSLVPLEHQQNCSQTYYSREMHKADLLLLHAPNDHSAHGGGRSPVTQDIIAAFQGLHYQEHRDLYH